MIKEQEERLKESFKEWRKQNTPPGMRLDVVTTGSLVEVTLCCAGSDEMFCYWCCREPDHPGECSSREKNVDFIPVEGREYMGLPVEAAQDLLAACSPKKNRKKRR